MSTRKNAYTDIATFTFEQALAELETIVKRLEAGNAPLENAIEDYSRGTALKAHCEKKLNEARLKVEKILVDQNGELDKEATDI